MPPHPATRIWVDGAYRGTGTVVETKLRRDQAHHIEAVLGDYYGAATVEPEISFAGNLDLVGGLFLFFPLAGMGEPGFYTLGTDEIVVTLR